MATKDGAMGQSWVDVQKQEGGTLTHTSSKEELKHMLASAASEEELSDNEQLISVAIQRGKAASVLGTLDDQSGGRGDDTEDEEEMISQVPSIKPTSSQIEYRSKLPSVGSFRVVESRRSFGDGICSLTLLVPVIILTHLAMFGIGYYLGRRWSADSSLAVMKVFHV